MALTNRDTEILAEIIKEEGKCLYSKRCLDCPFRSKCLPEFLNFIPLTPQQRVQMALDVLSYHQLLDDEDILEEVKSQHERSKNT